MHRALPSSVCRLALAFAVFLALLTIPQCLHAQYVPTESKAADLTAFVGYSDTNTDFSVQKDHGFLLGADYTRYFHFPVIPSLELRGNLNNGQVVDQHTYLAGPRLQMDFRYRYHPYVDYLIGMGYMHFHYPPQPGYTDDSSVVQAFGAGIDVDVYRNFLVKADFQNQLWNFGDNFTLSSKAISIGVAYRIPFKPHTSQQYVH